jgi:hypothetical protein
MTDPAARAPRSRAVRNPGFLRPLESKRLFHAPFSAFSMAEEVASAATTTAELEASSHKSPNDMDSNEEAAIHRYPGKGSDEDPYVVNFLDGDRGNPRNWRTVFSDCSQHQI